MSYTLLQNRSHSPACFRTADDNSTASASISRRIAPHRQAPLQHGLHAPAGAYTCSCTCLYMISHNARRRDVSHLTSIHCRHSHVPFSSPLKACTRSQTRRASSCRVMAAASEDLKQWPQQDKRRFLHAVYRVGNLDATIDYYKKHFGMKQLRYRDVPEVSDHAQHLLHTQLCTALLNCNTSMKLCCLQVTTSCALLSHCKIGIR